MPEGDEVQEDLFEFTDQAEHERKALCPTFAHLAKFQAGRVCL